MAIRLLVADDHDAVRMGVGGMVSGTNVEIVGQARQIAEVLQQAQVCQPDVVMLDLRLGDEDGFVALRQLRSWNPNLPVLMFCASENLAELSRAHELGACGYVPKTAEREVLLDAIYQAAKTRQAWTRPQLRRIHSAGEMDEPDTSTEAYLTPREREVLKQLVEGRVNDDIAQILCIQAETVKQHVKHILEKLGVEDRTQAALWAVRNKVV